MCHSLVLPQLVSCLRPDQEPGPDTENRLKGALFIIFGEKHLFSHSWEAASTLWPALVTAQHSDKQSE